MAIGRRLLAVLASVALATAGLLGAAGPAAATAVPLGQCTSTSGVMLAVDFSQWNGPLLRSCGTTPTTGYTLLNQGGWHSQGTQHDGPGFICRIGYSGYQNGTGYPTSDACINTPPTSAYWSYWHANPGQGSWTYSQDGAASYQPKPGSIELWTFGAGGAPGFSPDSVRAQNGGAPGGSSPAPAPHSSAPAGGGGGSSSGGSGSGSGSGSGGGSGSGSGSGAGGSTGASSTGAGSVGAGSDAGMNHGPASGSRPAKPAGSTAGRTSASGASAQATSTPTSAGGRPSMQNADPAPSNRHSTGSSLSVLITLALLGLLGAGAGVAGWRRLQVR